MRLPSGQEVLKNPGALGARDSIEIDAPPDNKRSSGEDENEIAVEIEWLKKEQKKIQRKIELRRLREHKARGFIKDVPEQESYMQRLVLERVKKVRNPDVYLGESQYTFDKYVSQVDLVFQTKPLTYASEEAKCLYAAAFLSGIPQRKWVAENQKINVDPDRGYNYPKFVAFLQEHKFPAQIRTANLIVCIGYL